MQTTSRNYTLAALLIIIAFLAFLFLQNPFVGSALGFVNAFISAPNDKVQSVSGRTNVLVMGVAGKGYAGSDLTDTLILASLSLAKPSLVLVSIPRDLWIPEIRAKVNSAYHYGGTSLAKESVARVAGVPIQYGVLIDFSSFKEIVDVLGGIEVNVERSFTDNLYPIAGRENDTCGGDKTFKCRYETVSFNAGVQMMDGATALKFVRSRHAQGLEGTDTAREARQQKIIDAVRNKILSPQVFLNPIKDIALFKIMKSSVQTDIDGAAGAVIVRKVLAARKSINQFLIPEALLKNPPISSIYDKQYVFIPKAGNGNWREVNSWFTSLLP